MRVRACWLSGSSSHRREVLVVGFRRGPALHRSRVFFSAPREGEKGDGSDQIESRTQREGKSRRGGGGGGGGGGGWGGGRGGGFVEKSSASTGVPTSLQSGWGPRKKPWQERRSVESFFPCYYCWYFNAGQPRIRAVSCSSPLSLALTLPSISLPRREESSSSPAFLSAIESVDV